MKTNTETNNVNRPKEIKGVYKKLDKLTKQRDALAEQCNVIDDQRHILMTALGILEPDYHQEPQPQQPDIPEFLQIQNKDTQELNTDLSDITVDFSAANKLVEKFFLLCEVAHAASKLINTGRSAQYLIDHEQSTAKFDNLKNSMSHIISEYSDYFERIELGTYKYRRDGFTEPEESANPEPEFDEE